MEGNKENGRRGDKNKLNVFICDISKKNVIMCCAETE